MRLVSILTSILLVACGGAGVNAPTQGFKVPSVFPSKDVVDKLAQAPTKPLPSRQVASLPEWRVESPPERSPIEARFEGLTFTKELRCIAREYGRLRSEQWLEPDERLTRFIISACGFSSQDVMAMFWSVTAPPSQSDEALIASVTGLNVRPEFKGKLAGAWLTRQGNQVTVTLAAGQPDDRTTASLADASGRLRVSGVAVGAEQVMAFVNRGADGVSECELDPTAPLPTFAFTCGLAESDPWAWIEVVTRAPGRLLLTTHALLMGRRDTTAALVLDRRSGGDAPGDHAAVVMEGVNRTRANAGLGPVVLAPDQSVTNARLAGHFFSANATHDGPAGDRVALGLMAGWDVHGGTIRDGSFFGSLLTGGKNANRWLEYALERPLGRFTLLKRDAQQIAIGAAQPETVGGQGLLVTTYSFFGAEDSAANAERIFARLTRERVARNLPAPTTLPELPSLTQQAAVVHAGNRDPQDALGTALTNDGQRLGRVLRGWVIATTDLEHVQIPGELLQPGSLAVRAVVTTYRPEGAPWGMYLVMLATPAPSQQNVAASLPPRRLARSPSVSAEN